MSSTVKKSSFSMPYSQDLWKRLQCVECKQGELLYQQKDNSATCSNCNCVFPIQDSVVDTLVNISSSTMKEITGMTMEAGMAAEDYENYKIMYTSKIKSLTDKMVMTEGDYNQYYQQTWFNFEQAFGHCNDLEKKWVLEIGACHDYYFLKPFAEAGANCVGLNIHFEILEGHAPGEWPAKILADMNKLPFQSSSLDFVVISATSHHSNTPEVLTQEIFRILKPGGKCLMINDPINGLIKSLGGDYEMDRHDHINENEYSISRYNKMFKKAGFQYEHLFSHFYDLKLQNAKIHPETRFAAIARFVAWTWQKPWARKFLMKYGLWFAQAIFGFPLNVILTKPAK